MLSLHDLIKDFLKYFEGEGYLFSYFFSTEMKYYITTFSLTTYLWIMNDKVMIYVVTKERMGSVIYFASITYHIKKSIANQSLSITAIFVSSCNGKERCVTRQNSCMGEQLPATPMFPWNETPRGDRLQFVKRTVLE